VSAVAVIAALRRIADDLVRCGHPDAPFFSAALQQYESGAAHGMTFGQAFALESNDRRETGWWKQAALDRRNTLLREIRRRHFPQLSTRRAAEAIVTAAARYCGGRWSLHRRAPAPPSGADALTVDLFALMRLQEELASLGSAKAREQGSPRRLVLGFSTVRAALANEPEGCNSHGPESNGLQDEIAQCGGDKK
jgi:hypothetical protein